MTPSSAVSTSARSRWASAVVVVGIETSARHAGELRIRPINAINPRYPAAVPTQSDGQSPLRFCTEFIATTQVRRIGNTLEDRVKK
jgi:hypothetical protein